ncbi:DNA circulation protein [Ferriphaselus amnicola]|uniref:DNA circulation protein n=1 Tax=Ferriphaselus amnicola TaxID=1188319 RepID=A0A2Z6GE82_9PROT|nr:DNA circularization N-terminal domain-containing protein [Ferriphaselus amnicola]BBE51777.1 DNA circulation protein [Ferriphaselus amnicola]
MSWADRMVTARFRDNPFLTESHDTKGGRRLVVHDYPGGEEPVVEDMGAKSGEFRLNAYFIGFDYDLFRDAFLVALNTPGAAWLDHPWRGQVWVRARDWSIHESNDKGGYCTISVDFVPGGKDAAMPTPDMADVASYSCANYLTGVMADFNLDAIPDLGMLSLIATVQMQLDKLRTIISLAQLPLTVLSQVRNVIDGLKTDLAVLLATPASYAAALRSLANVLGAVEKAPVVGKVMSTPSAASVGSFAAQLAGISNASVAATGSAATASSALIADTALPNLVTHLVTMATLPVVMPGGSGDSPALRRNLIREASLRGQLLLGAAAQVALADYRVANDRDVVLASVVGAIDQMLPSMSDTVFQLALDMRAGLSDALLAQSLEPAVVREVVNPLPATVLAHRMEVAEEIFLAVNKVRHPLFVQGKVYG